MILQLKNVESAYGLSQILFGVNLEVREGEVCCLLGRNGVGKSTTIKTIMGQVKPKSGEILFEGQNIAGRESFAINRMGVSYVPQGNFLLSGTIKENLTFINSDVTEDEINRAVQIACADSFINDLPDGLNTVIGERGVGLSEGQLQRLAIARSLLSKSPIMLLDEATSALDEATEKQFLTNLKDLKNKTCIIVSHKKAALDICNKCVQIIDSKIVTEEK